MNYKQQKGAISNRYGMILPLFYYSILPLALFPLRCLRHGHLRGAQHIFNENSVSRGGIVDKHVGDSSHKLAVLDNGRAAHECGQEGTTLFYKFLTVSTLFVKKKLLYCSI